MRLNMCKLKMVFGIDERTYQVNVSCMHLRSATEMSLYYRQRLVEFEGLAFSQVLPTISTSFASLLWWSLRRWKRSNVIRYPDCSPMEQCCFQLQDFSS